jgi:hypothetical protein
MLYNLSNGGITEEEQEVIEGTAISTVDWKAMVDNFTSAIATTIIIEIMVTNSRIHWSQVLDFRLVIIVFWACLFSSYALI